MTRPCIHINRGEGKFGRLGHGTERNQIIPRLVEAVMGKRVKQVACGGASACLDVS